ncbi:hypothetical protein FC24_GL001389 [Loigolactobacillus rennini DSM 20253]|uniref:Cytoplasmic protein n=1 Tax=Loigolactobacillus rennini DSM 20253 TaxID=1423796 RepID=A0A0R2DB05_9LACO|nr:hypothetical protein FC24_GL001389 [Loigolactobacillus rennini DSM 20253]
MWEAGNDMKEASQTLHKTIRITGQGDSKQKAVGNALAQIHKKISADSNQLAVRIIPEDIRIVSAIVETFKEHFLFFFFPRIRKKYQVTLDVTVNVMSLDLAALDFTEQKVSSPDKVLLSKVKSLARGGK